MVLCMNDVTSLPWQHDDATDESMMTTLMPAMIPTVVESERVTDDDDVHLSLSLLPPVSAADAHHQHIADCHRPVSVVQQGKLQPLQL